MWSIWPGCCPAPLWPCWWSTACGGADPLGPTHALPELLAGGAVVGLQLWRKNTLLSIAAGTVLYMVLVQLVFV